MPFPTPGSQLPPPPPPRPAELTPIPRVLTSKTKFLTSQGEGNRVSLHHEAFRLDV